VVLSIIERGFKKFMSQIEILNLNGQISSAILDFEISINKISFKLSNYDGLIKDVTV
jgi:hypothetical protein